MKIVAMMTIGMALTLATIGGCAGAPKPTDQLVQARASMAGQTIFSKE